MFYSAVIQTTVGLFPLSDPTVKSLTEQSGPNQQTPRSRFRGQQTRFCLICLQVGSYLQRANLVKFDIDSQHFASTQKGVQSAIFFRHFGKAI